MEDTSEKLFEKSKIRTLVQEKRWVFGFRLVIFSVFSWIEILKKVFHACFSERLLIENTEKKNFDSLKNCR